MRTTYWMVRGAMGIGAAVIATAAGCMGSDGEGATGVAQIAITQVPFDGSVGCIAVTATGAFSVTQSADVMPGFSSVLDLHGLPTGTVRFTGNAYAGPCQQVTPASVPTWLSDPVIATVSQVPVVVTLSMERNGQATVGVDFPDPSCRASGAPCLSGAECCSNICAGNACQAGCQPDGDGGCACTPKTCADLGFNCGVASDGCGGLIDCGSCSAGETCGGGGQPGVCAADICPPGLVSCGGACIDVTSDPNNCGACGALCAPGFACSAGLCVSATPTCSDGVKNGTETDVDCGGGTCPACASGRACSGDGDCQGGKCSGGTCVDMLLISEVQSRGDAGANDEFIEIYNPTSVPVIFDSTWEVWARSATSTPCGYLSRRFSGGGQTIPPHGHMLYANSIGYNGGVTPDGTYTTGFADSGQIVLLQNGALVDSVCFYYDATTEANLTCATPPSMWFACQGASVSNLPHNNTTTTSSMVDVSMERMPGGAAGNGQSTGDNAADWNTMVTANPQDLASAPTP